MNEIYKCSECDDIVEVVHEGKADLSCCGKPMVRQKEQTDEEGLSEKHRPVVKEQSDGAIIKIGALPHPMEKEHHIEWVEVITEGKLCRFALKPGDKPEVRSWLKDHSYVRAYCNVHGLWKN